MIKLNIQTTTCLRDIELLQLTKKSIEPGREYFDIKWHVIYDFFVDKFFEDSWIDERIETNVTFKANINRNKCLREIPLGEYVCYVDSDTIVHPNFFRRMKELIEYNPNIDMFVFGQDRCEGNFLHAAPENMVPCRVDGHQIVYKNNGRLWEESRTADGLLIQKLYEDYKNNTMFIPEILCYHNKLVDGAIQ